jgi:hypothetical protein
MSQIEIEKNSRAIANRIAASNIFVNMNGEVQSKPCPLKILRIALVSRRSILLSILASTADHLTA